MIDSHYGQEEKGSVRYADSNEACPATARVPEGRLTA